MKRRVRGAPAAVGGRRAGPRSVGRVFGILEAVAGASAGATLSELARATASPKTSLVGLLAGLAAEDCLRRDAGGRYLLGPRVHALANRVLAGREFVALARPVLRGLMEASGETAVIGALAPGEDLVVYLDKAESANPIRYAVTVGERRELHCTAGGKALLAHLEPARLDRYLAAGPRRRWTTTTLTTAAELRREIARIRREGIARTDGERAAGASGLAAPVFGADGGVVAAILIAGPTARMRANQRKNERLLRRAAAECSRLAGARMEKTTNDP